MKSPVPCFSASGVTAKPAKRPADATEMKKRASERDMSLLRLLKTTAIPHVS